VALHPGTIATAAVIEMKRLDEPEAIQREAVCGGSRAKMIMDVIKTGTILIENGTLLPRSLVLASEPYSRGWTTVTNLRTDFVREIDQAGWTFFFLAGHIQATVFGFNREKAVHTAVDRLIANARSQNCNCLEIGQVTMKSILGLRFARVSAHSRHIQGSSVFAGRRYDRHRESD
jgi:hypothetical protein